MREAVFLILVACDMFLDECIASQSNQLSRMGKHPFFLCNSSTVLHFVPVPASASVRSQKQEALGGIS